MPETELTSNLKNKSLRMTSAATRPDRASTSMLKSVMLGGGLPLTVTSTRPMQPNQLSW